MTASWEAAPHALFGAPEQAAEGGSRLNTQPGILVVLSAPSGAGKGTIREQLGLRLPDLKYGVSATTRPPRPGEEDGQDYFFVDRGRFEEWIRTDRLVEWAEVYGHLYGTPREPMET
ncbi:MAG: hypothetical protein WD535_02130, partial [Thermaerobacterales bacterium]